MTTCWRVTNRLGVDELVADRLEALELAARLGWGARVTAVTVRATREALALLPGEVIEETKAHVGAFYAEAIGTLAVQAGRMTLVEAVQ